MSKVELIKKLGWVEYSLFNNRTLYEYGKDSVCNYCLFEHRGDIGIVDGEEFKYFNLNESEIQRFTDAIKEMVDMLNNPKNYTLYQALQNRVTIENLLKEFAD